ncbi:MAG: hypothetical protein ACYC9H_01105 [Sulfuricaulis sp.]
MNSAAQPLAVVDNRFSPETSTTGNRAIELTAVLQNMAVAGGISACSGP